MNNQQFLPISETSEYLLSNEANTAYGRAWGNWPEKAMWIAWDTESLQWMFLSFPSQETQDALTNSCLVTPHPLSEEVSKKQIQLGCSEKWQEAENQELVCPMSLGAGASIPAVTHLPSRIYAINSTQDQGVDIGNWFGTNEWANDGD